VVKWLEESSKWRVNLVNRIELFGINRKLFISV